MGGVENWMETSECRFVKFNIDHITVSKRSSRSCERLRSNSARFWKGENWSPRYAWEANNSVFKFTHGIKLYLLNFYFIIILIRNVIFPFPFSLSFPNEKWKIKKEMKIKNFEFPLTVPPLQAIRVLTWESKAKSWRLGIEAKNQGLGHRVTLNDFARFNGALHNSGMKLRFYTRND